MKKMTSSDLSLATAAVLVSVGAGIFVAPSIPAVLGLTVAGTVFGNVAAMEIGKRKEEETKSQD